MGCVLGKEIPSDSRLLRPKPPANNIQSGPGSTQQEAEKTYISILSWPCRASGIQLWGLHSEGLVGPQSYPKPHLQASWSPQFPDSVLWMAIEFQAMTPLGVHSIGTPTLAVSQYLPQCLTLVRTRPLHRDGLTGSIWGEEDVWLWLQGRGCLEPPSGGQIYSMYFNHSPHSRESVSGKSSYSTLGGGTESRSAKAQKGGWFLSQMPL